MRRLLVALCAFALSITAWVGNPASAEAARPICPRGETFTNCAEVCPTDIVQYCASSIGAPNTWCPVDVGQSGCSYDALCGYSSWPYGLYNYRVTCTWYP